VASVALFTTPVGLDARLTWMLYLAWVIPALTGAVAKTLVVFFRPSEAAPTILLTIGIYLAWVALTLLASWRGLLIDVGRLLLARVPFAAWFVVGGVLVVLGSGDPLDHPWWALVIWVGGFTVAAAYASARASRKRFAFTVAGMVFAGLLLVGLDVLVGAFVLPRMTHNNIMVEHDAVLGWKLRRNTAIVRGDGRETWRQTINDEGFRTRRLPVAKPPGVKRVLFLGDSHTEAYTVDDADTYTVLIEQQLSRTRPVEVIALGVAGFSTDQEVLAYLRYGRAYRPDVVVLQFASNDVPFNVLERYWRGHKPLFQRYGDVLMLSGVPVPNFRNTELFEPTWLQRSALMLSIEGMLRQLAIRHGVRRKADIEEAWRVTALLLRDLDRIVRSDGARLVVFQADLNTDSEARLRAILGPLGVPYVETAGVYVGDSESYWIGRHWNEKGQQAIARFLSEALLPYL
jgi:hypothetical protein